MREALDALRAWRHDGAGERPTPEALLAWTRGRDAAVVVQLQVLELLRMTIHFEAWMMRYACMVPWEACRVCSGQGFLSASGEGVADPFLDPHADLASVIYRSSCGACYGTQEQPPGDVEAQVSGFLGWSRVRRFRGKLFKRHGLEYELRWLMGQDAWIDGEEPPTSTLGIWYRWAQEECKKYGYLMAVDLACSADRSCRRIGERLLGRRCERCEGKGTVYAAVEGARTGAMRFVECPGCAGSGAIVAWWAR